MDYGDFNIDMDNDQRIRDIDAIYDHFEVSSEEMSQAVNIAEVSYPKIPWSYYFLASCIAAGREIDDQSSDEELDIETAEMVENEADYLQPHQTYVIWMVWVDLGYNAPDMNPIAGDQSEAWEYERIPQMSLYETAERVMWNWVL